MALLLLALLAGSASLAATAGPDAPPSGPWREQIHWVPMRDGAGHERLLNTRICRPAGDHPAPLVVINHGKPHSPDLPKVVAASCTSEALEWFLRRGFVVALGVRRGYGVTGGTFAEDSGTCSAADLIRAGQEAARDINAIISYALALPFVRPHGVVVVGQSVGGWASDVLDSQPHPNVVAIVSMAGGHGGHVHDIPNNNCRPDQLTAAVGILGHTATTPMLWIYAENDSYFHPALAKAMYEAFTAGGGRAEFHPLPPFGKEGHRLFFGKGGSAIWGPIMQAYLARMGAL